MTQLRKGKGWQQEKRRREKFRSGCWATSSGKCQEIREDRQHEKLVVYFIGGPVIKLLIFNYRSLGTDT